MHDVRFLLVAELESGCEDGQRRIQVQDGTQARRLNRLGRCRVSIDEEQMRIAFLVLPLAHQESRRVCAGLGKRTLKTEQKQSRDVYCCPEEAP